MKMSNQEETEILAQSEVKIIIPELLWNGLDITKAALLLRNYEVSFGDNEEMRKVFVLLFDVFRYKEVLKEVLYEASYFEIYPDHKVEQHLVWLLLYDLYKRSFSPRTLDEVSNCRTLFATIGMLNIEETLWANRVKLAAELARLRIKNSALKLNQLLPVHLREDIKSAKETPVTGWVNAFLVNKEDIYVKIEALGLNIQIDGQDIIRDTDITFDNLCPNVFLCHPSQRLAISQSELVSTHQVVLQDRAFCLGPTFVSKNFTGFNLRGTVAQTHANSPKTTAYLATILLENDKVEKLLVFGAGKRLPEYQKYLKELNIKNCKIFADNFSNFDPDSEILENLVAVFATPPNSYTGIRDPVGVICSQAGDVSMVKALTHNVVEDGIEIVLDEQKETLKFGMLLPQVQFIVYETHSLCSAENIEMVQTVIQEMNAWAGGNDEEDTVPPCELFETKALPYEDDGCFVALIQRKEIIALGAKYLRKISAAKSLFNGSIPVSPKKFSAHKRNNFGTPRSLPAEVKPKTPKTRRIKVELERIAAPTHSSMHHRHCRDHAGQTRPTCCPRLARLCNG